VGELQGLDPMELKKVASVLWVPAQGGRETQVLGGQVQVLVLVDLKMAAWVL